MHRGVLASPFTKNAPFLYPRSRLGNGVLYASVNPEYFSAADGESDLWPLPPHFLCGYAPHSQLEELFPPCIDLAKAGGMQKVSGKALHVVKFIQPPHS